MRTLHLPLRWQTATVFAVSCFLGGLAVSLGFHEQQVGSAIEDARQQARLLEVQREELEATLAKAREVSEVSAAVADEQTVAAAAAELVYAASSAAHTVERASLAVAPTVTVAPRWANAPLGADAAQAPAVASPALVVDPTAVLDEVEQVLAGREHAARVPAAQTLVTPESLADASPSPSDAADSTPAPSPSPSAPVARAVAADEDAEELAALVADPEVAEVLRGQVTDLDTVAATVERLEEATAQIDAATRRLEGSAAVLAAATAEAELERDNLTLAQRRAALGTLADSATGMLKAVDGRVTDQSTVSDLKAVRAELSALQAESVDRKDPDAVATMLDDVAAARERFAAAEDRFARAHQGWVKKENERREKVNAKRQRAYERAVEKAYENGDAAYQALAYSRAAGWDGVPAGFSFANGAVPSSELCYLSFAPGAMLQCDAAASLERANDAYRSQTGRNLSVSSSYRSYAAQVATRASRGYYAAAPGTSNHGWGMAADFDPASSAWMRAYGESYGWVHPLWARPGGSKPESWHLEFIAPDVDLDLPRKPDLLSPVRNVLKD